MSVSLTELFSFSPSFHTLQSHLQKHGCAFSLVPTAPHIRSLPPRTNNPLSVTRICVSITLSSVSRSIRIHSSPLPATVPRIENAQLTREKKQWDQDLPILLLL